MYPFLFRYRYIFFVSSVLIACSMAIIAWMIVGRKIGSLPAPTLTSEVQATPTPSAEPSYTVVLLGRGGAGHDGGALTDTVVLIRVLYAQKRIVALSLPRDLWVRIPYAQNKQDFAGKLNLAYAIGLDTRNYPDKLPHYTGAHGGGTLAKDVIAQVTGVTVDRYVALDFSGFITAIDTIGGVDISVERAFTDYEYPIAGRERLECTQDPSVLSAPGVRTVAEEVAAGTVDPARLPKLSAEFPCRYEALSFSAGKQHMDGERALKYVRSRHSAVDGSDFSRSRRQRLLIEAVLTKMVQGNLLSTIPTMYSTLRSHLETDISLAEVVSFAPKFLEFRSYPVTQVSLTDDTYLQEGYSADRQYVLLPRAGEFSYTQIHNWVESLLSPTTALRYPTVLISGSISKQRQDQLTLELQQQGAVVHGQPKATTASTSALLKIANPQIDPEVLDAITTIVAPRSVATASGLPYDIEITFEKN